MRATLLRYFHTLRHLRPIQVRNRLWRRVARPRPDLRPAPPRRTTAGAWPGPMLRKPSITGPDTVRLLGRERRVTGWQAGGDALWLYNLHYFDDLNAPGDRDVWQRALIARWLAENPPAAGVGWEPFPSSLRILSWVRWILRGNPPLPGMVDSLAVQARHLRRRLEYHLLGNHLLANAVALCVAGAFFEGPEAEAWRADGARILGAELDEQLLPDGGHFERTAMYHALVLEQLLDLIALDRVFPGAVPIAARLRAKAPRMLAWLAAMTHPDGEIALFNDAALDVAAPPGDLAGFAAALGLAAPAPPDALVDLPDSGFTRIERDGAVLLADTGPLGPDYLPGHGHADTLGFELSIAGRRVVVDSGVSEYGASAERLRQRGTAAHSTVMVDGADSSEVWSGFRVARRARVLDRRVDAASIEAAHDGYHRLPGRITHRRRWRLADGLAVDDELTGEGRHRIEVRFHLAPGTALDGAIRVDTDPRLAWTVEDGTYHPRYGASIAAPVLTGRAEVALPFAFRTRIRWT